MILNPYFSSHFKIAPKKQLPRIITSELNKNTVYKFSNLNKALGCEINNRYSYFLSKKVKDTFQQLLKSALKAMQKVNKFEIEVFIKFVGMVKDSVNRPYGKFKVMESADEFYKQLCHENQQFVQFQSTEFNLNESACLKRKADEQDEVKNKKRSPAFPSLAFSVEDTPTCSKYLKN